MSANEPPETGPPEASEAQSENDVKSIDALREAYTVKTEMGKVIHGQHEVIEKLLICIFARGHGLLMGVPGLAKTMMVNSLAEIMSLQFSRIQFTPDLMPSDITGTDILQETETAGRRAFEFVKGPIFANTILADEINRTPPKTQAALLQAMQEMQITVMGKTYELEQPFFVLATQNPIEQEGTYPLPEAQLDRFMFFIQVAYPNREEELLIARTTTGSTPPPLNEILGREEILDFQQAVRRVPVPNHVYDYVVDLVRRSRPNAEDAPDWVKSWVTWGAGPRAVQYLILGGKARAALSGSYMVRMEDVDAITREVLTHRILLSFHAESEGVSSSDVIVRLTDEVKKHHAAA
ncbi:AAA family ATPase, partial [Planctomycetota bacterium]